MFFLVDTDGTELFAAKTKTAIAEFIGVRLAAVSRYMKLGGKVFSKKFKGCTIQERSSIDTLYIVVEPDKNELITGVYDSLDELSAAVGIEKQRINEFISHYESGRTKKCKYRKVPLDEPILTDELEVSKNG